MTAEDHVEDKRYRFSISKTTQAIVAPQASIVKSVKQVTGGQKRAVI
jgi:hypothetical protein